MREIEDAVVETQDRQTCGKVTLERAWFELESYAKRLGWEANTIESMRSQLRTFGRYLAERQVDDLKTVTREVMQGFQGWLAETRAPRTGEVYAIQSQCGFIQSVKAVYAALLEAGLVTSDVSRVLKHPRIPRRLPRYVTPEEMQEVLRQPDLDTWFGYRDRAILEVIYATLVRAGEVAGLLLKDVLEDRRSIFVRGKRRRDRVLPVAGVAWDYLIAYRDKVRPFLLPQTEHLFVGKNGRPLVTRLVSMLVTRVLERVGLEDATGAHLVRYAGATHMLEAGADIRYVQDLLGHQSIENTMRYCLASAVMLKRVHEKTHPREKGSQRGSQP